jgi:hypothetical protein
VRRSPALAAQLLLLEPKVGDAQARGVVAHDGLDILREAIDCLSGCVEASASIRRDGRRNLQAQRARRRMQVRDNGWGTEKGRVHENAEQRNTGHQLAEQLQLFRRKLPR